MIGENATPQDPFLSRESCFEILVSEDMTKEGREVLSLGLDNEDPCICLGRDGAIVTVLPNGSEFSKNYARHISWPSQSNIYLHYEFSM